MPTSEVKYFFQVRSPTAGAYSVRMEQLADDHGNAPAAATPIANEAVSGVISYDLDSDWFAFQATAGQHISYSITATYEDGSPAIAPPYVRFTEHDNNDWDRSTYIADKAGTHYAIVKWYNLVSYTGHQLKYTLTLHYGAGDDIPDPQSAPTLQMGVMQNARLDRDGDVDYFKARLEAGTTYVINGPGLSRVVVTDPVMMFNDIWATDESGNFSFTADATREYTLGVSNFFSRGGSYSLTINRVANDVGGTPGTAGEMVVGKLVESTLDGVCSDFDWYAITLSAGVSYQLDVGFRPQRNGSVISYAIGTVDGLGRTSGTLPADTVGGSTTVLYTPEKSGIYYVSAWDAWGAATGAYSLRVAPAVPDDAGNNTGDAKAFALDAVVKGTVESINDIDYYKVVLQAGKFYGLSFDGVNHDGSKAPVSAMWLVGPDGKNIYAEPYIHAATSGTYYVVVNDMYKRLKDYMFTLKAGVADDHGQTAQAGTPLALGSTGSGVIQNGQDVDFFTTHLTAGQSYTLRVTSTGTVEGSIFISGPDGQFLHSNSLKAQNEVLFTAATSGSYGFAVDASGPASFSYTLNLETREADTVAPALLTYSPGGDGGKAPLFGEIAIGFSEPVRFDVGNVVVKGPSSVVGNFFATGNNWRAEGSMLYLKLPGVIAPGTTYKVLINYDAIVDASGNRLPERTFQFTTQDASEQPSAGSDVLKDRGQALIDGGAGIDALVLQGDSWTYKLAKTASGFSLTRGDGTQLALANLERIYFGGLNDATALDIDGNAGQAYRMYQAAFNRTPDKAGLGYWITMMDKGMSLSAVANGFVASNEFKSMYGASPTHTQLVNKLYENVLHRPGEAAGIEYWTKVLEGGASVAAVLASFSESPENLAGVATIIGNGFSYTLYG